MSRQPGRMLCLLLILTAWPSSSQADDALPRRTEWGLAVEPLADGAPGLRVRALPAQGAGERAGLRLDDVISHVNGRAVRGLADWRAAQARVPAGDALTLTLVRAGQLTERRLQPLPAPSEAHACCDVLYDSVLDAAGRRVRTIVTRPHGLPQRRPALLFVGRLTCDTVELPDTGGDGWAHALRDLTRRSGFVVMRVEKAGVGDSQGDCAATDFATELSAYQAALGALRAATFVDPHAVFLFGAELGGAMAPLLAADAAPRGIAVWGTFARTWLEHVLERERRRLTLAGEAPAAISDALRALAEWHAASQPQPLPDALRARAALAPLWRGGPGTFDGRPSAYFQQVQALNLAAAWARVDAPVLTLYGAHDWLASRADHESIAAWSPARRRCVAVPRVDQSFSAYPSARQAYAQQAGQIDLGALDTLRQWMREVLGAGAR